MSEETNLEIIKKIFSLKKELDDKIVIPTHHYQDPDIVRFGDFIGDSYKLAVESSKAKSKFIVFCGVLFMAEGADILSNADQKVLLPDPMAGCPMADMADIKFVEKAFKTIKENTSDDIVPIVYMNSYADLKSFCGENGGSVCTSSNAEIIINYYFKQNKKVLFFPDYYLGKNTANIIGLKDNQTAKITRTGEIENKNNIDNIKMFLWDGFCHVHQVFSIGDIKTLRDKYPDIKIIVHPESKEEVVDAADLSGSTEKIFKLVEASPAGSIWGVGTETTFVNRIAKDNPDKTVLPLRESICKNMIKITPEKLLKSLESIVDYLNKHGELSHEISVKETYKEGAKKALKKMIEIVEN